jgi:hypothetical protein
VVAISSKLTSVTTFLYLFLIVTQLISGVYLASGRETPPTFAAVYVFGFLWMIGWWLRDDSKRREIRWVYDIGFFLYLAWPFVLPYYLLKSRGLKGILAVLAFIGVYIRATVLGIVLYLLLAPKGWLTAV